MVIATHLSPERAARCVGSRPQKCQRHTAVVTGGCVGRGEDRMLMRTLE